MAHSDGSGGDGMTVGVAHVPKTAGTSLRRVLETWYGAQLATHYPVAQSITSRVQGRPWVGHVPIGTYPADVRVLTLRHPIHRVLSHFTYLSAITPPAHAPQYHHDLHAGMTLGEFAEATPNMQTRFLGMYTPADVDVPVITEHLQAGITRLALMLDKPNMLAPRLNVTAAPRPPVNPATLAVVARHNRDDADLYDEMVARAVGGTA